MSGRYDPERSRLGPFVGARLYSAVWDPTPPGALVTAISSTAIAIPKEITCGLDWIVILRAWAGLMRTAPSALLDVCWRRTIDLDGAPALNPLEAEVQVTCGLTRALLDRASPEELVAFSRTRRKP